MNTEFRMVAFLIIGLRQEELVSQSPVSCDEGLNTEFWTVMFLPSSFTVKSELSESTNIVGAVMETVYGDPSITRCDRLADPAKKRKQRQN